MTPFISVIVPCYKQAQYLHSALESVLNQSFKDWECIIVNDGSPDETEAVAQEWCSLDSRFRYVKQANSGLASARNLGISEAKGLYFQFLDADDVLESDKFQYHRNHIDGTIDVSIAGYRYFEDGDSQSRQRIIGPNDITPEVVVTKNDCLDLPLLLARRNIFVVCSPVYKADLVRSLGGFEESLLALEDWYLNLRLALSGARFDHFGYPAMSRALVRLHPTSMSQDSEQIQENYRVFQDLCSSLPEYKSCASIQAKLGERKAQNHSPTHSSNFSRAKALIRYCSPPVVIDIAEMLVGPIHSILTAK